MKQVFLNQLTIISCMCALFSCTAPKEKITIPLTASDDATLTVLAAIEQVAAGNANEIVFEKGTYHFYPDKAIEKYTHTSNHGDYLSRIAFYINNAKDLIIDGAGAEFIFHNRIYPFFITNSENITLKNFSINYAERFSSEPIIVANDTKNHTFDIEIPQGEKYEIRNNVLYFVQADYDFTIGQSILYDPIRESVAYNTEAYTAIAGFGRVKNPVTFDFKYAQDRNDTYQKIRGREYRQKAKEIAPGIIRIYNHKKALPPVGMVLSCKGEQGVNRLAPAVKITHTRNFTAENVTVFHASGMGFLGENSENILLDSCCVMPAKGYLVSTTADATHFVGCRGKVTLRNCTLRNQLDDAMNVHGAYQPIVDKIDDYTIGVRMAHFQQQGFVVAQVADTLGLVRIADSFHAYKTLTVKKVKYINGRYNQITFNEKLPAELKMGDLVENLSAYPSVEVNGCYIGGNRARGLLISTPKGTLIENNTFATEMEAILLPVESGHWYESGNAANVTIRNNTFKDCNFSGFSRGIICFRTDDDLENMAFSNIDILDNTFDQFDNMILEIRNVDGFRFEGNTILNSKTFPQLHPNNPVCTFKYCKNVSLKNNNYQGKAQTMVKMLDNSTPITFN